MTTCRRGDRTVGALFLATRYRKKAVSSCTFRASRAWPALPCSRFKGPVVAWYHEGADDVSRCHNLKHSLVQILVALVIGGGSRLSVYLCGVLRHHSSGVPKRPTCRWKRTGGCGILGGLDPA